MIHSIDPVLTTFQIRAKVPLARETIVMVFVLSEMVQQSRSRREIRAVRVTVVAYLEMIDVVAARIGDVLVLCHGMTNSRSHLSQ
jgi:hypothetical protein